MELYINPLGMVDGERPRQGLTTLKAAGFGAVATELALHYSAQLPPRESWRNDKWESRLDAYRVTCREAGVASEVAMCMPRLPRALKPAEAENLRKAIADLVAKVGPEVRYILLPALAGTAGTLDDAYYIELAHRLAASGSRAQLLLMNTCRNIGGHLVRGLMCDEGEIIVTLARLNAAVGPVPTAMDSEGVVASLASETPTACGERFGFALDMGAANLYGGSVYELITTVGERLRAVIVTENDGVHDAGCLPFSVASTGGSPLPWLGLIRGLRDRDFDGMLVLDIRASLTALSPLLRADMLPLARRVADYLVWQLSIEQQLARYPRRVLFGAGNMCRNYMKCYGAKYPPLFTCDNNRAMWGREFAGLTVHSPEDLRGLAADCAIFIANVYYREIEEQLRAMGLENPILRFNDEYLPSYPFDRVDVAAREVR